MINRLIFFGVLLWNATAVLAQPSAAIESDVCIFVTFALPASHTAFSSIRMEPVFMVTSQSAAAATCLAMDDHVPVQKVDQMKLRTRLIADKQVIEFKSPSAPSQP